MKLICDQGKKEEGGGLNKVRGMVKMELRRRKTWKWHFTALVAEFFWDGGGGGGGSGSSVGLRRGSGRYEEKPRYNVYGG